MSNVRLQEIALLPLDQRAARIAQLFAEGAEAEAAAAPRAPEKRTRLRTRLRNLAFWARPDRLSVALTALAAVVGGKFFDASFAPRPRADGFCGVARIPNGEAAIELYARGLCFDAFPGLAALWSPPRRAIVRPADSLRLPGGGLERGAAEAILDRDFERHLDLCDAQPVGAGRRPAFPAALSELFAHGLAHSLELRDGAETQAVIVGVAIGRVFTVEGFFARDRASFARAVAALARHLAGLNFSAVDFRAPSPQIYGLPIELISREGFLALLAQPGGARAGRWRKPAPEKAPDPMERQRAA